MSQHRMEWKVGLFVALGLALLAILILNFSKGVSLFASTFEIRLRTTNVGGIKSQAGVLMAGVPVGNVLAAELAPDGRSVFLRLRIQRQFSIHADAVFNIEQSGFLGDQFVSVTPGPNLAPLLKGGEELTCQEPFNLQEAARAALGFIHRIDDTARRLNDAIVRIDRLLLNEETLTNLAQSVTTFYRGATQAEKTLARIDSLVTSNLPPVSQTITNLMIFSQDMRLLGRDLQEVLATNSTEVTAAVKSIESSAAILKDLLANLEAGKGLGGRLLKDEQLSLQFSLLASNLTVTTSNLNARGIWGVLWKPKAPPAPRAPARPSRR